MKKIVIIGMVVLLVAALFIDDRLVDDLCRTIGIFITISRDGGQS